MWERDSEIVIHTPVSRRTRQQTHTIAPLRQGAGSDGPVYVKIPFTATDLMTWKQAAGNYRERLKRYQKWVLYGIRHAMPKSLNWSKLYEVRQDKNESPSAFLERLKEAARKYTDLRVETEAAQIQLALIFMGQSAPDIRKKLQKLEGENSRSLNAMLEVAWRVYNNREKEERRSRRIDLLAVMAGTTDRGRGRGRGFNGRGGYMNCGDRKFNTLLGINQCALCKEEGHWKKDCPRNRSASHDLAKVMVLDD
ncbi:uncharacterized protein LOC119140782 [Falco rusticolus]|uniref:uncharacterized protein LOC119140782 n=1 Tax=Falco rusticolus TaxID=120794 RepID=UPI001886A555|nr:uncharacterized protein LOC119140782 [Falco rusticolus]